MDFPTLRHTPTHINLFNEHMAGRAAASMGVSTLTAGAWPVANLALFWPIFLPWPYYVARAFWCNGTSGSGNQDIGIYSPGGARIWAAGSTASSGFSVIQYVNAGIQLSPGVYYLAVSMDGTTGRTYGTNFSVSPLGRCFGVLQQASAFPLPAQATFAAFSQTVGTHLPIVGITRTPSGF